MKVLSKVALVVGVLVLLAGVGVGIWGSWIAYWHYATLSTGRSAEFENPVVQISLAGLMLLLGGFLAGLGLGMPRAEAKLPPPTG